MREQRLYLRTCAANAPVIAEVGGSRRSDDLSVSEPPSLQSEWLVSLSMPASGPTFEPRRIRDLCLAISCYIEAEK